MDIKLLKTLNEELIRLNEDAMKKAKNKTMTDEAFFAIYDAVSRKNGLDGQRA